MSKRVAVFARPAEAGQVQTRLSPALPPASVAELHAALLADTLDAARECAADERTLWWSGEPLAEAPPSGFCVRALAGADPGERMARAFGSLMQSHGDRVVIVGCDLPDLKAADLDRAFDSLASHDLVLGPAFERGYWLVGLSKPAPELFAGVAWDGEHVFAQTLGAASRAGLRVRSLEGRMDLVTPADLVLLVATAAASPGSVFGANASSALRRLGMLPG